MAVKRTSIEVFVEIPRGSRNKYEFDKERGIFKLDRVLYSSVHYPSDYGFIADTLSLDGDPLDALVILDIPTFPGCVVDARPIGILDMTDEQGHDEKILAVPTHDPRYRHITKLEDLGPHWLREIENFFATYKALEDKWTELVGWKDETVAWQVIEEAEHRYHRYKEMKKAKPVAEPAQITRQDFKVDKAELIAMEAQPEEKSN
ncbi:MAG TPA: inorganic diphosphatase [Chloroflexia bacterium]|nr:inorganic diphosphatase [Chloroflexia bacterium]